MGQSGQQTAASTGADGAGAPPARTQAAREQTGLSAGRIQKALASTAGHQQWQLTVPWLGRISLPPPEHLGFYAGIAALAALEIVDWPVAALVAIGKALADNQHFKGLQELGEALESA